MHGGPCYFGLSNESTILQRGIQLHEYDAEKKVLKRQDKKCKIMPWAAGAFRKVYKVDTI